RSSRSHTLNQCAQNTSSVGWPFSKSLPNASPPSVMTSKLGALAAASALLESATESVRTEAMRNAAVRKRWRCMVTFSTLRLDVEVSLLLKIRNPLHGHRMQGGNETLREIVQRLVVQLHRHLAHLCVDAL